MTIAIITGNIIVGKSNGEVGHQRKSFINANQCDVLMIKRTGPPPKNENYNFEI